MSWFVDISDIRNICYCQTDSKPIGLAMPTTLIVSNRGQITLPAATRNRFGIKGGDVVVLEDRGNEIVLKPGIVLQVDVYSDEQIAEWDAADRLDDDERKRIVDAALGRR